jgi:hypothetical protein
MNDEMTQKLHFIILYFLLTCLCFNQVNAQDAINTDDKKISKKDKKEEKNNKVPQKGDIYFSPVPVLGANPAFGFIYGAGASTSWYMGDPSTTQLSSAMAGLAFTTKKQTIITLKSTVFLEDNDFIFMGDWRYLNSSQPTWGLGTGPQSAKLASNNFGFDDGTIDGNSEADMLKFKFFRFYETALKKIGDKGFYAGVGVHIDIFSDFKDQLLDLQAQPQVITPFYAYNVDNGFSQEKSTLIGLSLNGVYDTRDNINNTYTGRYAFVSLKMNPTFLGSDQSSTSLWLEYRDYFNITPDHNNIIAVWATGSFTTSGNMPYMNLPATAWDQYGKSSEPYSQGRFRGNNLMFAGVEFRKHIWATKNNPKFLGAAVFASGTTASGYKNGISLFDYIEPGAGAGVRINISKKARTNLGIDYGWGAYGTTGFFLRLNENF